MSRFKFFRLISRFIPLKTFRAVLEFVKDYFVGLFQRLDDHHIFLSAGGIAYSVLISMIPMVLLIFSFLGNIIDVTSVEVQVNKLIDTIIPYPESATYLKRFILSRIPEVIQYKTIAGYFGAFGLLFTSTWLFSSMRTTLNRIFGVSEEKNALIGLLRDFGMVVLLIVLVFSGTFILPILNILIDSADKIEPLRFLKMSELSDFILGIVTVLIIFVMFFVFYYLIPYEKLGKRVPVISAFWATLLWEVARNIFGYYISNFLIINKVYGAFILIAVVLFWIFYSCTIFIISAEIGQIYRERLIIRGKRKIEET